MALRMAIKPRLVATSGPLLGRALELDADEVSIGRTGSATIAIDHMSVSRRHCAFLRDGETFRVRDSGSLNRTLVNGMQVEEQTLRHGDTIAFF